MDKLIIGILVGLLCFIITKIVDYTVRLESKKSLTLLIICTIVLFCFSYNIIYEPQNRMLLNIYQAKGTGYLESVIHIILKDKSYSTFVILTSLICLIITAYSYLKMMIDEKKICNFYLDEIEKGNNIIDWFKLNEKVNSDEDNIKNVFYNLKSKGIITREVNLKIYSYN